jgi:hypothetical protein
LFLASKAGGAMALNSRPNRLSGSVLHQSVIPTQDGAPGSRDAVCYRKFNQPENSKPYYKTQATKDCLQEEFDAKPQRTAKQVHERKKAKKTSDGGAYFSYSQRGEVGLVAKNSPEYADWPGYSMCGKKLCQCHG